MSRRPVPAALTTRMPMDAIEVLAMLLAVIASGYLVRLLPVSLPLPLL